MSIISTTKKWDDILSRESSKALLKSLETKVAVAKKAKEKSIVPAKHIVLLYGAAKDNKAAAAALIGKELNKTIYRVDLASTVSKYIGETEKNLDKIFKGADSKNPILFFDEADALFGKRTTVKDSHDKYANTAANYLLQKIEGANQTVIMSSATKSSIPAILIKHIKNSTRFTKR